jgi:hypothetical protein
MLNTNILVHATSASEAKAKAKSLEVLSQLSQKSLTFLTSLNVQKADKKLSEPFAQSMIKGFLK